MTSVYMLITKQMKVTPQTGENPLHLFTTFILKKILCCQKVCILFLSRNNEDIQPVKGYNFVANFSYLCLLEERNQCSE